MKPVAPVLHCHEGFQGGIGWRKMQKQNVEMFLGWAWQRGVKELPVDLQKLNGALVPAHCSSPGTWSVVKEGWVGAHGAGRPQGAASCPVQSCAPAGAPRVSSPVVSPPAQSCQRRVIQRVTKGTRISFPQPLWFQVKQPLTNEKA